MTEKMFADLLAFFGFLGLLFFLSLLVIHDGEGDDDDDDE
jgi:hypothetical protein